MTTFDEQLAQDTAGGVYLAELHFTTGTAYLCSWSHNLDWAGHTWQGFGRLVSVSGVMDAEGLQYPALDLALAVQDPTLLALCRADVHTYRRQPVFVYLGQLDDQLRKVDEPQLVWSGLMDQVRLRTGDGGEEPATAMLRCELQGRDKRAPQSLRLNNAQQQQRYPGDTGLSRIEEMNGRPVSWLSTLFQRRD